MSILTKNRVHIAIAAIIGTLLAVPGARAAMDPRFELDPKVLAGEKDGAKPRTATKKRTSRLHAKQSSGAHASGIYTIKPGDHIFRILMRDYGLSNNEAEAYIEEIKRENNIYDIKRLKVGQKINIPLVRRRADGSLILPQGARGDASTQDGSEAAPAQTFKLESPNAPFSAPEAVARVQNVWNRIIPPISGQQKPLSFKSPAFSLTLDPERFPTLARIGGGRIILDQNASIPPLLKSLIEDKDPSIRIVTEAPAGTKRFMSSVLAAAGFYSVEENFSMEFGVDPKLTVQADFKVEKTAESLIKQDIVLVNSGSTSLPSALGEFLGKEGFSLYEPFASPRPLGQHGARSIDYVSVKKQPEMIDSILSSLSVTPERNHSLDVFAADNNGISLSVNAERYFERGGKRYVVTGFDGDPITYTLFRILEARGYAVVILDAQDDFRKISEKIISRMKLKGVYGQHTLLQPDQAGFSLQMSGFKLEDDLLPAGGIFLTDRPMDRIIRDLFTENGFTINSR
ncbi:MAG: LysM domain-containing protein [Desulfuromonadaceae bacterium]|nr:LysM domain-containing protein [Desulfuromonadaceae bacterium]